MSLSSVILVGLIIALIFVVILYLAISVKYNKNARIVEKEIVDDIKEIEEKQEDKVETNNVVDFQPQPVVEESVPVEPQPIVEEPKNIFASQPIIENINEPVEETKDNSDLEQSTIPEIKDDVVEKPIRPVEKTSNDATPEEELTPVDVVESFDPLDSVEKIDI